MGAAKRARTQNWSSGTLEERADWAMAELACMPLKCEMCGACCRDRVVEITANDLKREPRLNDYVRDRRELTNYAVRNDCEGVLDIGRKESPHDACPFLRDNCCTIEKTKPDVCRDFVPSLLICKVSRVRLNIKLGTPLEDLAHFVLTMNADKWKENCGLTDEEIEARRNDDPNFLKNSYDEYLEEKKMFKTRLEENHVDIEEFFKIRNLPQMLN